MGRETQPAGRILIVEDDAAERHGISSALRLRGHEVIEAETCEEALRLFNHSLDAVITDLRLPDGDAVQLLPKMRAIDLTVPVYVMTGFASIDVAVKAVKLGAEEFFTKPVEIATLLACVDKAIERRMTVKSGKLRRFDPEEYFAPSSDAMRELENEIERLRTSDVSVLIIGEVGTGKSMLAERLHDQSVKRSNGPFIEVSCGGLKKDFVDTELFGPDSGNTGAGPSSSFAPALFDAAKGGTLYLDEIGDVDLEAQPKMLKALDGPQRDFRIIASSHDDLVSAATNKTFRADLFYRISTVTLRVPPLRERKADLQPIVERMLTQRGAAGQKLTPEAWEKITSYSWPGNLSELRNVLERALISRKEGDAITAEDIRFDQSFTAGGGGPSNVDATLEQVERDHIERALEAEKGRVKDAARRLGIPRSTLYQKIKNFGIPLPVRARQTSGTTMKAINQPIPRVSGEVKIKLPGGDEGDDEDAPGDGDNKAGVS
jgi:DNA-binding NtrC family response regulator